MHQYRAQLQFINLTAPNEIKNENIQTVVKTHAMKEFRREERWNLERGSTSSTRQTSRQASPSETGRETASKPAVIQHSCNRGNQHLFKQHAAPLYCG